MRFFKMMTAQKTAFLVALAMALSACVKPQNHGSNSDDTASFYVDEVKSAMDTAETVSGFTIPQARLFTFTACIKDRRTDEALPGAPFVISGGERDLDIHTDKDGCAVWSEKIAFDYLANEKFLPITRTVTAKGSQVGARKLKLAINPWMLSSKSVSMYDLDHHPDLPQAQVATDEQVRSATTSELAGANPHKLTIVKLPIKNSGVPTSDGSIVRLLKVYLDPSIQLTDIDGNLVSVAVGVSSGKLRVTGALIESLTTGGQETRTIVSKTPAVPVSVGDGKTSADLQFKIGQGLAGSRYFLALKVEPVGGPKGLQAFEGLFAIGDRNAITEEGASAGELKGSNNDDTFAFDKSLSSAQVFQAKTNVNGIDDKTVQAGGGNGFEAIRSGPFTNAGNGNQLKTFAISQILATFSGRKKEYANLRTIKYWAKVCIRDLSNGGKPAAGTEFSIQKANGKWITATTSTLPDMEGCLQWEDEITHNFYDPEHIYVIPVTFKHKSGYTETRQYGVDPWQFFKFPIDPIAQKEWISDVNKQAASLPSYLVPGGVEFSTLAPMKYEVDKSMSLSVLKTVRVKIPITVSRPSDVINGINTQNEPLRPGLFLMRAALVAPQLSVDGKTRLVVSKMDGDSQIVEAQGGAIFADLQLAIPDIRVLATRSFLVFQIYLLDEQRLPQNAKGLKGRDLMKYVARESKLKVPAFAAVLNARNEKDSSGVLFPVGELGQTPMTVADPGVRGAIEPLLRQTLDSLYAQADRQRAGYEASMKPQRSLGVVAGRANVEFAFLTNEAHVFKSNPGRNDKPDQILLRNNKLLPSPDRALAPLLKTLNAPLTSMGSHTIDGGAALNVTRDVLWQALFGGTKPLDARLGAQLCGYFFYTQPRTRYPNANWNRISNHWLSGTWVNDCVEAVKAKGVDTVFSIDHRLRVLENAGVVEQHGRSDQQVKTAASIGFSQFQQTAENWASSFGTGGITSEVSRSLLARYGSPLMRVFTSVVGGLGYEISRVKTDGMMGQNGYAFEFGHGFTVDQTDLKFKITKWDECLIVRPSPAMFLGQDGASHMDLLRNEIGSAQAEELMNRGLMVCGGMNRTDPRVIRETYYTLNSSNPGGTTNDVWDARNLPWILQLRGQRDFASFLVISSASKVSPNDPNHAREIGDVSNQFIQNAYDKYYAGKMSTMPGFITLEPKRVFGAR